MLPANNATTGAVVETGFYIAAGQVINPPDGSLLSVAVGCVIHIVIHDLDRLSVVTKPENAMIRSIRVPGNL